MIKVTNSQESNTKDVAYIPVYTYFTGVLYKDLVTPLINANGLFVKLINGSLVCLSSSPPRVVYNTSDYIVREYKRVEPEIVISKTASPDVPGSEIPNGTSFTGEIGGTRGTFVKVSRDSTIIISGDLSKRVCVWGDDNYTVKGYVSVDVEIKI